MSAKTPPAPLAPGHPLLVLLDNLETAARWLALDEREYERGHYSRAGFEEAWANRDHHRAVLDAELARLVADAERLDWMEAQGMLVQAHVIGDWTWSQCAQPGAVRATIDALRAALHPSTHPDHTEDTVSETASNRPPYETFKRAWCRGSLAFGTACGTCEKCEWERNRLTAARAVEGATP